MSFKKELLSLQDLAARLPFQLDASEDVNEAYVTHVHEPSRESARLIDLWTYCFIRRYYLIKFVREKSYLAGELEAVVEQTYRKVDRGRRSLRESARYAQWVSVVCKNNYLNFVTRRSPVTAVEISDAVYELPLAEPIVDEPGWPEPVVDVGALYVALSRAIDRLPPFLQNATRMRFVEQLSYEEISRLTGHSVATVRAYIHKACTRFRTDEGLAPFKSWYQK